MYKNSINYSIYIQILALSVLDTLRDETNYYYF